MKIIKKISFLFGYTFPLTIVLGYHWGGSNWTFAGVCYAYLFIPIIDQLMGKDSDNVLKADFDKLVNDRYFDFLVYSNVYIQYCLLFWGTWVLATAPLTNVQQLGLMLSMGVFSSGIINIAHELGHRSSKSAQFHSKLALMSVSYMHFFIEHNRGHHVHVATPADPATSKKNQTLYQFWVQTLVGSYRSAWNIEQKRLLKENKSTWGVHNAMLWFAVLPLLFCGALVLFGYWFNPSPTTVVCVMALFVVQSIVAILSLEAVNYIEHYGIVRRQINGRYERVNPLHSWNANHFVSNLVLFQLQRHSDHHAYASRPYQVLRHFDECPQLPFGYTVMIMMALYPPLWFSVMNRRLESWQYKAYDAEHIAQVVRQFA